MYEAIEDPYCYPGTLVLKNKIGIRTQQALDAFEAEMSAQRAIEPLPAGKLDYIHYCAIHKHLFGDVDPWAGKTRTVRIAKDGSMFCYPESINREMNKLFAALATEHHFRSLSVQTFAKKAAHFGRAECNPSFSRGKWPLPTHLFDHVGRARRTSPQLQKDETSSDTESGYR